MIKQGKSGWEQALPAYVDSIIKEKGLFGCKVEKADADK